MGMWAARRTGDDDGAPGFGIADARMFATVFNDEPQAHRLPDHGFDLGVHAFTVPVAGMSTLGCTLRTWSWN